MHEARLGMALGRCEKGNRNQRAVVESHWTAANDWDCLAAPG